MGVRGLSTFIARNANEYYQSYQLHNTYLVIDGYCLASHLYKWHSKCNDCFGGDYDKYAYTVYKFFALLQECSVTPIVIFDGGYENRKLKTVYSRMKERIRVARNLNSVTQGGLNLFPLFVRELFKDIVLKLQVKAVKCNFEGDYEIACVARILDCPVMSYDSDFYLFDVKYIPFSTVELQVYINKEKIKYIPCKMYKIEKFLNAFGGLSRTNIPLLGVLLGNDYIKRSTFKNFYEHIKLAKRKNAKSDQQRRILAIVHWLKHETFESAVAKILARMKTEKRRFVANKIKQIAKGYVCTNSEIMKYLGISIENTNTEIKAVTTLVDKLTEIHLIDDDVVEEMIEMVTNSEKENNEDEIDSEDESEEEINDENDIEEVQWGKITVPEWFFDNFRQCKYPSCFMDILFRNTYYFTPQVENYELPCSHEISLDIVAAIHAILKPNSEIGLFYFLRYEQNNYKHCQLEPGKYSLPSLNEIYNMDIIHRKNTLLDILNVDKTFCDVLDFFPSNWRLYIITIKYWFEKAQSHVLSYHLYALLLCGIIIQYCDTKVGFYRSTKKFLNKYENKINSFAATLDSTNCDQELYRDEITFNDALNCLNVLIDYFQLNHRMKSSIKLFDISIVHTFAQFQSCLLHINYLNSLLNCPLENTVISEFYDGTFVYNACTNFEKRSCIETYVKTLLNGCPSVLSKLLRMINKLDSSLNLNVHVSTVIKRRRRKRNKKNNVDKCNNDDGSKEDESSGSEIIDENNRFSVLLSKNCYV